MGKVACMVKMQVVATRRRDDPIPAPKLPSFLVSLEARLGFEMA